MYLVSRTETFAKLFFIVSFSGLFAYVVLAFYTFHTAYTNMANLKNVQKKIQRLPDPGFHIVENRFTEDLKYILWWTINETEKYKGEGQLPFVGNNCTYINCFLTTNKNLLDGDYTNFDALIIDVPFAQMWHKRYLPRARSIKQKYIFYGLEAASMNTVCNTEADNYFNWTWSFKLYSDIFSPFIEVKDLQGNVVAPNINVEWRSNAPNISLEQKNIYDNKTKALAWVMNKCGTREHRLPFARELFTILKHKKLVFDIYNCGHLKCRNNECKEALKRDYYFYLVFEDSLEEDYVTTEVLKAYNNDVVPIIISGADLTKFLPVGSYINSRFHSPDKVAAIIEYSLQIPSVYYSFHRWKKYYTFHEVEPLRGICQLCNYLNNFRLVNTHSSYETFRKWWYPGSLQDRCLPKGAEKYTDVLSYINSSYKGG